MKISTVPLSTPAGRAITATGTKIPYYTAKNADDLWSVLATWEQRKYPRTSWSWLETGDKESTLKAKLYNGLRYLQEQGTPEQRRIADRITFSKIGNSYVLTLRRERRGLAAATMQTSAPTPDAAEGERQRGDITAAIVKFMAETFWDGPADGARPCLERVGVHITEEFRAELVDLVNAHGSFAAMIEAGYKGTIRVIALAVGERRPS